MNEIRANKAGREEIATLHARIAALEARAEAAEEGAAELEKMWEKAEAGRVELAAIAEKEIGVLQRQLATCHRARLEDANRHEKQIAAAEAEAQRYKEALETVEEWMASEDGPLYHLWENYDIGDYDDTPTDWEQTLFDIRDWKNGCVPTASLGYGTEWPVVDLYRSILAALAPDEKEAT